VSDFELFVPLEGLIDFTKEKARLRKEEDLLQADEKRLQERLDNPDFAARAPQEEVEKTRARLQETRLKLERLRGYLRALSGA
jgi:valyl-tRNA synthetase